MELSAYTQQGAALVARAEALADELATRAADHDREASFPHASVDALKRAGYFSAPIPVEHGGLGVTSVHDVVVASSRLARGDASVAIGVNMHLVILLNIVRRWQAAVAAADQRRIAAFGGTMEAIARDGVVIAAAISELGQALTRPRTRATRTESRWRIDEGAARIVDRALALSDGAGYLNGHPLARADRDVRAGSFMHPLGANRAYDFLGDVALGREPVLG